MTEIIHASLNDLPVLRQLVEECQTELFKLGDYEVVPSARTIDAIMGVAHNYITGFQLGLVIMDSGRNSYAIAGGQFAKPDWETTLGTVATENSAYVRPHLRRTGIARDIWVFGLNALKGLGFDTMVIGAHSHNAGYEAMLKRIGFKPLERLDFLRLDEMKVEDA